MINKKIKERLKSASYIFYKSNTSKSTANIDHAIKIENRMIEEIGSINKLKSTL